MKRGPAALVGRIRHKEIAMQGARSDDPRRDLASPDEDRARGGEADGDLDVGAFAGGQKRRRVGMLAIYRP